MPILFLYGHYTGGRQSDTTWKGLIYFYDRRQTLGRDLRGTGGSKDLLSEGGLIVRRERLWFMMLA